MGDRGRSREIAGDRWRSREIAADIKREWWGAPPKDAPLGVQAATAGSTTPPPKRIRSGGVAVSAGRVRCLFVCVPLPRDPSLTPPSPSAALAFLKALACLAVARPAASPLSPQLCIYACIRAFSRSSVTGVRVVVRFLSHSIRASISVGSYPHTTSRLAAALCSRLGCARASLGRRLVLLLLLLLLLRLLLVLLVLLLRLLRAPRCDGAAGQRQGQGWGGVGRDGPGTAAALMGGGDLPPCLSLAAPLLHSAASSVPAAAAALLPSPPLPSPPLSSSAGGATLAADSLVSSWRPQRTAERPATAPSLSVAVSTPDCPRGAPPPRCVNA